MIKLSNYINEKIILPLNDVVFGRTVYKHFKFLQKSQWWSATELKSYQNVKLKLLIKHAYENVPYYRNLFDSLNLKPENIQTQEDLQKLPVLTKEIVRANFPDNIVSKNYKPKELILSGSSGSTGQPLQYYRTKDSLSFGRAANIRGWYWMGFRLGDPYIKISTMARSSIYKKAQDFFNNCTFIHSRSLSEYDIIQIISKIQNSKSKFVRGYPASLYIIASYLKKHNNTNIYLNAINTTSEPLYPYMRQLIEEVFHCPIFDSYGAEGSPIISQCEYQSLYHISSELSIVEFIRNDASVNTGQAKMLFTDLTNFATPFIRYDVKDYVVLTDKRCSCGRGLPVIESIGGRETDILITPSGKYITFYFFAGYFEHLDFIDLFQFVQDKSDEFILKIVPNENFNEKNQLKIEKDILDVLGPEVKLSIEVLKDIPLTNSGKRRFFIRNPQIKINI